MMHAGQIEPITVEEAVKANLDWYWSDVQSTLTAYPSNKASWYDITGIHILEDDKYWLVNIDNGCPPDGVVDGGGNIVVSKVTGEIFSFQMFDADDCAELADLIDGDCQVTDLPV